MKEIESNKHAWDQLSKDHYESFKESGMIEIDDYELFNFDFNTNKFPMSFSLKASPR